jgi:hypothetical protein
MKRTIEEQRSQRVLRTATIICCAIWISTMITLMKYKYQETIDSTNSFEAFLVSTLVLMLCCGCGFAAGYGVKQLWREPYEE